jgi:ubiquinol-cytochrome c reductase cytochrome c1 subunit
MTYMAEPSRTERESLGWWVLAFLAILFVPVYLLNKEYWKDVK